MKEIFFSIALSITGAILISGAMVAMAIIDSSTVSTDYDFSIAIPIGVVLSLSGIISSILNIKKDN